MNLRILWLFFLVICAVSLSIWALDLQKKPEQMTVQVEEVLRPVSEILSGRDPLIKMELEANGLKIDFALQSNGWWWMTSPEQGMADQQTVYQWDRAITAPRIQRILKPEEWRGVKADFLLKARLIGRNTQSVIEYILLPSQKDSFYYLKLENGSVLKCEKQFSPLWPQNVEGMRTKRLFPFQLDSVAKLSMGAEGGAGGKELRIWTRKGRQWTSQGQLTEEWKTFLKKWLDQTCLSFVNDHVPAGNPLAFLEIEFVEGGKAQVELRKSPLGQWVLSYKGRSIAQVLDEETAKLCFPILKSFHR